MLQLQQKVEEEIPEQSNVENALSGGAAIAMGELSTLKEMEMELKMEMEMELELDGSQCPPRLSGWWWLIGHFTGFS